MADDDGIRLRNVSPLGDLEVPDLGLIVELHHEVVVADESVAARLIEGGHFTQVGKPGPKTPEPAAGGQTQTPADSGDQDTTTGEEPTDDDAA